MLRVDSSWKSGKLLHCSSSPGGSHTPSKIQVRERNVKPKRWWLYLPRNLSDCGGLCWEEVSRHVKSKTKLLDNYLRQHHPELLIPCLDSHRRSSFEALLTPSELQALRHKEDSGISSPTGEPPQFFLPDPNSSSKDKDFQSSSIFSEPFLIEGEPKWLGYTENKCDVTRARSKSCMSKKDVLHRTQFNRIRSKQVRFADSLGLELEHVRSFLTEDLPVIIPESYSCDEKKSCISKKDMKIKLSASRRRLNSTIGSFTRVTKQLQPLFTLPTADKVWDDNRGNVYLDGLIIMPETLSLLGVVRVKNIHFEKMVVVRYTLDKWNTTHQLTCKYIDSTSSKNHTSYDKFSFNLFISRNLAVGARIEFAIRYRVQLYEFWDNNNGRNYVVECMNSVENTSNQSSNNSLKNMQVEDNERVLFTATGLRIYPNSKLIFT